MAARRLVVGLARLGPALLPLLALLPGGLAAQTLRLPDDANTTVAERPRPEFDPPGAVAGTFVIHPRLRTALLYDDNVYADEKDAQGDTAFIVSPQLRASSQLPGRYIDLAAGGEGAKHAQQTNNDYLDLFARGGLIADVGRQDRLGATLDVSRVHEDRDSADQQGIDALTMITQAGGQVSYRKGLDRLFVQGTLGGDYFTYYNEDDNQSDRDRVIGRSALKAGYQLSPRVALFGETRLSRIQYVEEESDLGIKRSSINYYAGVGSDVELTGLLFGSAGIGVIHRAYDGSDLDDVTGPAANLDLTWNPTDLTSVVLDGKVSLEETRITVGGEQSSSDQVKEVNLRLFHELRPNLILQARTRVARDDYEDTSRSDDTIQLGFGARWLLNRNLSADAGYTFTRRFSNTEDADFTRNLFLAGVTLTF